METKQYYALKLDDYARPAFSSGLKVYVGTLDDIQGLMRHLDQDYPDTAAAFERYLAGDHEATHIMAYQKMKLLEPVDCLCERTMQLGEQQWEHINTWECPYVMKFSEAKISQIMIRYQDRWYRCMKAWMTDLCYQNVRGSWTPLDGGFWGLRGILDVNQLPDNRFVVNNVLFMLEEAFDHLDRAKDSFHTMPPQFREICNDIFGDG